MDYEWSHFFPLFPMSVFRRTLTLAAVLLAGCSSGQTLVEEGALNTEGNTVMTEGEAPEQWPVDVPLYPDAAVAFSAMNVIDGKQTAVIALSSSEGAEKVVKFYEERLAEEGWKTENVMVSTIASGMEAVKDGRRLQLAVLGEGKETTISIAVETEGQ